MKLNHTTGQAAENVALAFLQAQGCILLARNWHCAYGEIDLIMRSGSLLLFIEVKYRKNTAFGGVAYSIGASKLAKLQRSIEHYLQTHHLHKQACRLDAVLIQGQNPPQWIQNLTG
ncbi:MAG: YraN family protein [Alysiella sp.]|uniref:YraN family protein n=1 Tax=Alysiella sp. TaxID=1872483 RepID=UPI0026DC9204|nr:YraN family protein [Alysiella sp.]MDO4433829.1 YraN family protein [Alysiella sp.]